MSATDIFSLSDHHADFRISLVEYLDAFASESKFKMNTAGRLEYSLGDPTVVNTALDERLGRMFSKRVIRIYPAFADLYGIEDTIQRITDFLRVAAAGFPAERQVLYIHGPPSSGKSTVASRLLERYERVPLWTLAVPTKRDGQDAFEVSPFLEHPLGLFNEREHGEYLEEMYKIPRCRLQTTMSPWAAHHLQKLGTRQKFLVARVMPWGATSTGIATADFSANQDTRFLVGRPGPKFSYEDYIASGALNRTTQGLVELSEMFKVHDENQLQPLMTATADRWYVGAGGIGRLPFQGLPIAYSNTDDFENFKERENTSGLLSRIFEVKVPLPTSVTADTQVLRECIARSDSKNMPVTPGALEVISVFAVASRLKKADRDLRLRLYDGQNLGVLKKDVGRKMEHEGNRQLTADDYRADAKFEEGMRGVLLRQELSWIPFLADSDPTGVHENALAENSTGKPSAEAGSSEVRLGLDPISTIKRLVRIAKEEDIDTFQSDVDVPKDLIEKYCVSWAEQIISRLVRRAYPEDFNWYLRDKFGRYFTMLDHWEDGKEYVEPESKIVFDRQAQEAVLSKLEKPMSVSNPRDFRRALWEKLLPYEDEFNRAGGTPWRGLDPDLWGQIEEALLPGRDELLPTDEERQENKKLFTIAFIYRDTQAERDKHARYVQRFIDLCTDTRAGTSCTPAQARRMLVWYINGCKKSDLMQ